MSLSWRSRVAIKGGAIKGGDQGWRSRVAIKGGDQGWRSRVAIKGGDQGWRSRVAIKGKVLGFNPDTGERLWSCDTDITWYMVPCVVANVGIVYVLGGRSGIAALAVRAGGRGDVTTTHRLWTGTDGSNVTSPVYQDGHLYWMHEKLGIAYCARVETGEIVYEKRMSRAGQIYASTILADGHVYHLNRSGTTFVLAAKPEFQLVSTNDLSDGSQFNASPAVSGNWLLIRSEKFLYCVE